MPNQTPIPTQINIAPSGMTWKNWKLVQGTDGFPTRETMEKYLCNPDRVRDLEECRDLNLQTIKQLEALIQLYEAQMEAVGAGGVEPLRKCNKLHQIAEPVQAAAVQQGVQAEGERSATYGMNIAQRILHVGGRENAQTYIEFGSVEAVRMLVAQVLRDLPNGFPDFCSPYTHPTQQGLDAQALKQSFREYLSVSEHIDAGGHAMDSIATDLTRIVLAEEEVSAVIARRVHCNTSGQSGEDAENIRAAAQAKQGGV